MADILNTDLTQGTIAGTGVFDHLMRAVKAHLDVEYTSNRIKGNEYSQVYLGAITTVLEQAASFLLAREKVNLEASLLEKQILLADKEIEKATAQIALVQQQTENALAELEIIQNNASKVTAEVALLTSQKNKVDQDVLNGVTEGANLVKQGCLLDAQYDLTMENKLKSAAETTILAQKLVTERAQTIASGVDVDSVVGRQKALYKAQADGFANDARQKAAQIMMQSWITRKTTDPDDTGTAISTDNNLTNQDVGLAIRAMFAGIDVTT